MAGVFALCGPHPWHIGQSSYSLHWLCALCQAIFPVNCIHILLIDTCSALSIGLSSQCPLLPPIDIVSLCSWGVALNLSQMRDECFLHKWNNSSHSTHGPSLPPCLPVGAWKARCHQHRSQPDAQNALIAASGVQEKMRCSMLMLQNSQW